MKVFATILISVALIIIVWQLTRINYADLSWATNKSPYNGLINMSLLITSMLILIKTYKPRETDDKSS